MLVEFLPQHRKQFWLRKSLNTQQPLSFLGEVLVALCSLTSKPCRTSEPSHEHDVPSPDQYGVDHHTNKPSTSLSSLKPVKASKFMPLLTNTYASPQVVERLSCSISSLSSHCFVAFGYHTPLISAGPAVGCWLHTLVVPRGKSALLGDGSNASKGPLRRKGC